MRTSRHHVFVIGSRGLCATLALILAATGVMAQQTGKPVERIWRDPGNMAALDLIHGAGGKVNAPDATGLFTFGSEDAVASSPKFDVTDARGTIWKIKLGEEARSETAATRFLWAAGYIVDEDYYLADLRVTGLPVLRRGQEFVSDGGVVHGARLERKPATDAKLGD